MHNLGFQILDQNVEFRISNFNMSRSLLKYSEHLKTRQVWFLNGRKLSGCRMVEYSNGI